MTRRLGLIVTDEAQRTAQGADEARTLLRRQLQGQVDTPGVRPQTKT